MFGRRQYRIVYSDGVCVCLDVIVLDIRVSDWMCLRVLLAEQWATQLIGMDETIYYSNTLCRIFKYIKWVGGAVVEI